MTEETISEKVHLGRNVKRMREILGIKQEVLANELGMSQQNFSDLEKREVIDDELLKKVANSMQVSIEAIKNFDNERVVNNITQHFSDHAVSHAVSHNVYGTNNYNSDPTDREKIIEMYEKRLKEKDAEIERLRKEKK